MQILICSILIILNTLNCFSQKSIARSIFTYNKYSDQSRTLTYSIRNNNSDSIRSRVVKGIPVTFSFGIKKNKLGTLNTDDKGVVKFNIPSWQFLTVFDNQCRYYATIDQNSSFETRTDSISVSDLNLETKLINKDSVKSFIIFAYQVDSNKNNKPSKVVVNIYVKRTFSELKIGEVTTDSSGYGAISLPTNMPGDSVGNLTIISRVEDNPEYANVEMINNINGGIPVNFHVVKFQRTLWTKIAPVWMIVTLTILLIGVWFHFIYVFIKLISIKREGKQISNINIGGTYEKVD